MYGKTLNGDRIFPIFYTFASKNNSIMKYFEVHFIINNAPEELIQDARDILSALAGEAGFETFEDTPQGISGYVQQVLFDEDLLKTLIISFPIEGVTINYEVKEADDRNWNEQWEQEGFEPIIVKSRINTSENYQEKTAIIHDGRQTTRMMVAAILEQEEKDCVLDCGCGTGILGIVALKDGAQRCVAYDIDEWSADNARHNAVINGVSESFISMLGDASVLNDVEGTFNLVMANINRNILLTDMPAFRSKMAEEGTLLLSGFYKEDIPLLAQRAAELGLRIVAQKEENNWACLTLKL